MSFSNHSPLVYGMFYRRRNLVTHIAYAHGYKFLCGLPWSVPYQQVIPGVPVCSTCLVRYDWVLENTDNEWSLFSGLVRRICEKFTDLDWCAKDKIPMWAQHHLGTFVK